MQSILGSDSETNENNVDSLGQAQEEAIDVNASSSMMTEEQEEQLKEAIDDQQSEGAATEHVTETGYLDSGSSNDEKEHQGVPLDPEESTGVVGDQDQGAGFIPVQIEESKPDEAQKESVEENIENPELVQPNDIQQPQDVYHQEAHQQQPDPLFDSDQQRQQEQEQDVEHSHYYPQEHDDQTQEPPHHPQDEFQHQPPPQDESQHNDNHSHLDQGMLPDWLLILLHEHAIIDGDKLALVGIISLTILTLHAINCFINKSSRETPLIRRLAELDRKLFAASNELLILKREQSEKVMTGAGDTCSDDGQMLREMELQLQQTCAELETSRASLMSESERANRILSELESSKREAGLAQDEARQAQEMVEEMIANQGSKTGAAGADEQLMQVVTQLQSQLESQKVVLGKYEPRLKKKEKENKELVSQIKQLRADVANANLEKEKIKKELTDTMRSVEESASKLNEVFKNEEEWKSLSDLLQSQLEEKNVAISDMETEMSSLRSRISVFKNEAESKEEQLEVLRETLDELQNRSLSGKSVTNGDSGNGWDVEEEENGWDTEDIDNIKEVAKLKVENKRNKEMKAALETQLQELKTKLESTSSDMETFKAEADAMKEARDEVVKDHADLERRMEVLTEFFNKKEAELQRQLGLQSAKFGDVSSDAESAARQLVSVTAELDNTKDQVRIIKGELEEQERSLKASVAAQEKKAHENWVAARQAERKLTELQVRHDT